jgi:hypothetical protein
MRAFHRMPLCGRCDSTGTVGFIQPGGWIEYHLLDTPFEFLLNRWLVKTCPQCNGDPVAYRTQQRPAPPPPPPPKNTGQQNSATNEMVRKALANSVQKVEIRNAGTKFAQVEVVLAAYGPEVGELTRFAEGALKDRIDQQNRTGKYAGRPITVHEHYDGPREYPENGPFG